MLEEYLNSHSLRSVGNTINMVALHANNHSLQILGTTTYPEEVYELRMKVIQYLKAHGITDYLFYREVRPDTLYRLQAIPYSRSDNLLLKSFEILFSNTFGSIYSPLPSELPTLEETAREVNVVIHKACPFCDPKQILSQEIFHGRTVSLLYNLSPLCEPHFLIVPHEHRKTAFDVSKEEYVESEEMITKLITYFEKSGYPFAFIFDHTGKLAGETVPHFHIQVAFARSRTEELFGKYLVLQRTLIGKSDLSPVEFTRRVRHFQLNFSAHFDMIGQSAK